MPFNRIVVEPPRLVPSRSVAARDDETLSRYVGDYRIDGGDVRAIKAGRLLWTQRGKGMPLPIRPVSETEFFYEGQASRLTFRIDAAGKVTGRMLHAAGTEQGEPAERIR